MAKATGHGGIDSPDFIQATTPHQNPVEITLSELAIRLGYPGVFERTGNVLHYDTFEYGLSTWSLVGDVSSHVPRLSCKGLLQSPYALKLPMAIATAAYSTARKRIAYPYITTYGLEISFLPMEAFGLLYFGATIYTGEYAYYCYMQYRDDESKLYIMNYQGVFVEVATYNIDAHFNPIWHPVKLVVDLVNERYARVMVDGLDLGLSTYPLYKSASAESAYILLYISNTESGGIRGTMHIDNFILTINEPT